MVSRTRRALLGSSVALLATLAGCETRFRKTPTRETADVESGSVRDPEYVRLRSRESDRPVTLSTEAGETRNASPIVSSRGRADRLEYAADVDADAVRVLVADTDFETESIVLDNNPVKECYRLELCGVSWSNEGVHTDYGRALRDADVACRADELVSATTVIRVPAVLDPDVVSLSSSSTRTGRCGPRQDDASTTSAGTATTNDTTTGDETPVDGTATDVIRTGEGDR